MQLNVGKEIAAMEQMAVGQLRNRYAEVFGETTNARGHLQRAIHLSLDRSSEPSNCRSGVWEWQ